ncbi:MAG: hypothetical protein GY754_16295 [bacterium]|nr:hypothetical protein [bacterium]
MTETTIMRLIVLATIVVYFVFYLIDRKHVVDEREQLIELKAISFQQNISMWGLIAIVSVYVYNPALDAVYPIIVFALSSVYTYMLGKLYYRKRM